MFLLWVVVGHRQCERVARPWNWGRDYEPLGACNVSCEREMPVERILSRLEPIGQTIRGYKISQNALFQVYETIREYFFLRLGVNVADKSLRGIMKIVTLIRLALF
jgi:hypothetical protein